MIKNHLGHVLFKTSDFDAPDCVKDRNGEVVLGLCRKCNRGEIELCDPCDAPQFASYPPIASVPEPFARNRAVDASNTIASLLGALIDQPRILTECAGYADLSPFADQVEAKAVAARVLADELLAASVAMRGESRLRRVA